MTSFVYGSFFFGTMMGEAKFVVEGNIMPPLSKSVNYFLSQAWCFSGHVYDFWSKGLRLSWSIRVIRTKSVCHCQ